jgi:hypothetical protein
MTAAEATNELACRFSLDESRAGRHGSGWRPLPPAAGQPAKLHEAMRYTVLDGGKRVRPLLAFAAGELHGADRDALARAAAAVEMIHAYSLVHDDMPCMDDDALRRGKPTVHVKYDEATALLVGDCAAIAGLQVLAEAGVIAGALVTMLRVLAEASGSAGMCGGQAIDLASVGITLSAGGTGADAQLKTGALLRASRCCWARWRRRCSRRGNRSARRLLGRHRPGLSGGRRRARCDRRFGHPGQDRRQGRGGPTSRPMCRSSGWSSRRRWRKN